jgi:osmoprotectant transport system permease protein
MSESGGSYSRRWWLLMLAGLVAVFAVFAVLAAVIPLRAPRGVHVGSKSFTESVILGELARFRAESAGAAAAHRQQLGGTLILWKALVNGDIDVYPEYTGTITQEILSGKGLRSDADIRRALDGYGIRMSQPLGFADNYAIGMRKDVAQRLGIRTISNLRQHPELTFGFSNEFLDRADGWPGLRDRYRLPQRDVRGLEHELAYRGLVNGTIAATELYTTDAKIRHYDLVALVDDLGYFPSYQAVLLYRADLEQRAPEALAAILQLQGRITEADMIEMNSRVDADRVSESQVAADFLHQRLGMTAQAQVETEAGRFIVLTYQHVIMVLLSLAGAILLAVPLGILASREPRTGQVILALTGLIQTIPSIALLAFMIPLLGIGVLPAMTALFLYSLLPIVRNTYTGLQEIPLHVRESAEALGLPALARLRLVELPMAARTILAGIKTAAVINVGTATLGGLIGAGGYGDLIFRGIRTNNNAVILQGAIAAAVLALLVQGVFELAERRLVPRGLRLKPE